RCVEEIGHYDESLRYTQDADMLIRLARRFPLVRVPRKLMRVRRHGEMGSASSAWAREAGPFYQSWLDRLSLEELFPELGAGASAAERARARAWMAERYAASAMRPFNRLAAGQYVEAVRESPATLPSAAAKIVAALAGPAMRRVKRHRQFYKIGARSAASRLFARARRGAR
ncbi:MAG TPA: hypothetical protein VNZ44_07505, partial [Pyrinomonadaceae bacterium]|nr:hypothetical protein [Pyrinomonadaceae bacterium]